MCNPYDENFVLIYYEMMSFLHLEVDFEDFVQIWMKQTLLQLFQIAGVEIKYVSFIAALLFHKMTLI